MANPTSSHSCTGGTCRRASTASTCWSCRGATSASNRSLSGALDFKLACAKCNLIRFSESFPDAGVLLAECAGLGLEGIVAKWRDSPYRSGTRSGWIKVKTAEWKTANKYRTKLFEKPARN